MLAEGRTPTAQRPAAADARPMQPGAGLAAPGHLHRRPHLCIDAQHGLCNRLRAIASAAGIAAQTDRRLVVIWRSDVHCQARIGDLLAYPGPVIESDAEADLLRARSARVYNYMEVEPGARFEEPILPPGDNPAGDVHVRSAYPLASPHRDYAFERRFLRGLVAAEPVRALVAGLRPQSDVAVHIRMASGPGFDHLPHEAPDNWPAHRHAELADWRRKSHADRFAARLDRMVAEGEIDTIFLAADLPDTYAGFAARYGDRLAWQPRDLYDRSARQLQHALADLILLAACPRLLASTWSSFSEVAELLAPERTRVERSGIDF